MEEDATNSNASDTPVQKLVANGYKIQHVIQALSLAEVNGDVDLALAWLLENIGDPDELSEEETESGKEEDLKMVMVVRMDLKMGKGKIAAQCSHACLGAYIRASREIPEILSRWYSGGAAKVVLQCKTGEELFQLEEAALDHKIVHYLVRDAGRTQIAPGSHTVLAIGPDFNSKIDLVSGLLKLL